MHVFRQKTVTKGGRNGVWKEVLRTHLASDRVVQRGQTLGEDGQIALNLRLFVFLVGNLLVDFLALLAEVLDACGRRDAGGNV